MTTIDHRILIPAPAEAVWHYISDIAQNPTWQVDCREIIFLTSRREGPGLRWRYSTPGGHEYVIAVTAWYNGLGYEYYFVDGAPFKENIGRVRLQEIPEGTVVQWTFTYELGGVFGGFRNALSVSRQIDKTIADSLKTLWQELKQTVPPQTLEPKSLMRDAPNVEQRSSYQPRHPSAAAQSSETKESSLAVEPPVTGDDAQPIRVLDEPPLKDEDTRPNQAAAVRPEPAVEDIPQDIEGEPEFLDRLVDLSRFEPPPDASDTKPRRPVTPEEISPPTTPEPESSAAPPMEQPPVFAALLDTDAKPPENEPAVEAARPAASIEDSEPEAAPPAVESMTNIDPAKTSSQSQSAGGTPKPPAEVDIGEVDVGEPSTSEVPPAPAEPVPSARDIGSASIWEIFGVPRPSESQEIPAAQAESAQSTVEAETTREFTPPEKMKYPPASSHTGMRIGLRRKLVHLRRP